MTLFEVIKRMLKPSHRYECARITDGARAMLEAKRGDYFPDDLVELGGVLYRVIN